jgi:nicotinate-nucleotide adenylyltransferase
MSLSFSEHTAVFGGSFNPPHIGHLEAIAGVKANPNVARVVVVPSYGTPLKTVSTSFDQRAEMSRIAFSDCAEIDLIEGKEKIQYTWQLLSLLSQRHPKFAFVIGTDQFESLPRWSRFPDVLAMSDWIVLLRKPKKIADLKIGIEALVSKRILTPTTDELEFQIAGSKRVLRFVETTASEISSTEIREKFALAKKDETQRYLPRGVFEYIERNQLYGT